MERLLDALETLLLRIRCGQTLSAALQGMPECRAPAPVRRAWILLRERILAGEVPAETSLRAWITHLRLHHKIDGLIRQRTVGPRLQSRVILMLAWFFWAVSTIFFPSELQPSLEQALGTAGLLGAGTWWIRHLVQNASRAMWAAEWLVFLSKLSASLSWGQTFGPALAGAWEEHGRESAWPPSLRRALAKLLTACRNHEGLDEETWINASERDGEERQALEQLTWINRLREEGRPMAEFIENCVRHSQEQLERRLTTRAEALAMKLLLPLFVCFLPAFLIVLFGPVMGLLWRAP